MKRVFFILFLTVFIFAKDNFIYETHDKEMIERIERLENDLIIVKSKQESSEETADEIERNHKLIKINSSKIAEIKTINSANAQKIAQIADSLNSIKNILQESKNKSPFQPSVKIIEMKSDKASSEYHSPVKKEDIDRHSVMIENLTDRVLILEKELKSVEQMISGSEPRKALYDYFEYFVIITVVLFFLMFIIIFILAYRTKRLHQELNELSLPVKE